MEINVDTLLVLRFDKEHNRVVIEEEKIPQLINLKTIDKLFTYRQALDIIDEITRHQNLNVLLKSFKSYCQNFHDSYTEIPAMSMTNYERQDIDTIERVYKYKLITDEDKENVEKKIEDQKNKLKKELELRVVAYNLEEVYKKMNAAIQEKNIVAFSHRRVGWSFPEYKLTDNFSIDVKTNFGYGRVSYFFVCLKYKGIEIIPFTEWVTYSNAIYNQIIKYTRRFFLQNSEWKDVMNYAAEACNLSLTDETTFVNKYIVDECEGMVSALERFLISGELTFKKWNWRKREDVIVEKFNVNNKNLVELKGSKISGALEFISKILLFKEIIDVQKYIDRIEECNRQVQLMLPKEIAAIDERLNNLNQKLNDVIMPAYKEYSKKDIEYNKIKNEIRKELVRNKVHWQQLTNEVDAKMSIEYPEYHNFIVAYDKVKQKKNEIETKIASLKTTQKNIEKYQREIERYFSVKEHTVNL